MSMGPNGGRRFELHFSSVIAEAIRQLQRRASREGRGQEFLQALRTAVERLEIDPANCGEPLYRLTVLRLQIRCMVIRPLSIDFAIREDKPQVFIKAVRLLTASDS
jgi:hypothetical protein